MLRHVVGDNTFFQILKTYYGDSKHRYATATTEDFQKICERVSGINLQKFFQQWIYEEYYPQYFYSWDWIKNSSGYEIQLNIQQNKDNHIFWMPIDVSITTVDSESTFVVWDSLQTQSFQLSVASEPVQLELDKDNWILKETFFREPIVDPLFDKGILLVNGLAFSSEVLNAYQSQAFWGDYPISFWDCFDAPVNGYPATLPEPLGHGKVPSSVLGQYSTVIWVGSNYEGDLERWLETSVLSYLEAGGNLILVAERGQDFLNADMQEYLGITLSENSPVRTRNCVATYSGLNDMTVIFTQYYNAIFDTASISAQSTLLFKETASFDIPKGIGVWSKPAAGGTNRSDGGQFVFISGKPYRYAAGELRSNMAFMLANFFAEPITSVKTVSQNLVSSSFKLQQNYPNPFNPATVISYQLPVSAEVELIVFSVTGQKVATLISERQAAGTHKYEWDASAFASGVYFCRLTAGEFVQMRKLLLLK
jgi:hypothetical protein